MLTPGLRGRAAAAAAAGELLEVEANALVLSGTPTISNCREERTANTKEVACLAVSIEHGRHQHLHDGYTVVPVCTYVQPQFSRTLPSPRTYVRSLPTRLLDRAILATVRGVLQCTRDSCASMHKNTSPRRAAVGCLTSYFRRGMVAPPPTETQGAWQHFTRFCPFLGSPSSPTARAKR